MDQDFLLDTAAARRLYHDHAKDRPIIDYHTHLPPAQVTGDRHFDNLAQAWLEADHYKWRAMRAAGVPESLVSGGLPPGHRSRVLGFAEFQAWAATLEQLPGNPLWHWTHLELKAYFDCNLVLSRQTAKAVWEHCNTRLADPALGAVGMMQKMKVACVCTTDDPCDDLELHRQWAARRNPAKADNPAPDRTAGADPSASGAATSSRLPGMFPSFRPDRAMDFSKPALWLDWCKRLEASSGIQATSLEDFIAALDLRHQYFHRQGCRISDHGLAVCPAVSLPAATLEAAYQAVRRGQALDPEQAEGLRTHILSEVAAMNRRRDWTMQLHLGPIRALNTRRFGAIGPDVGDDGLSDRPQAEALAAFLDICQTRDALGRTILYTLNPGSNEALASIMGAFQDGITPGKIQLGSAWWFNDHLEGMTRQLKDLAAFGLLGRFVGMLTDSRSFLSFPRHEYFRRILCRLVGRWVDEGQLPDDQAWLGGLVEDIAWRNARDYFRLDI